MSLCWIEYANMDVAVAGVMARTMDAVICASPLVAPKDRLFGAAAVMNISIQPEN